MFSRLVFHIFSGIIINWQLLNFEAVFVIDLVGHAAAVTADRSLRLSSRLTVIIIRKWYFRMTLVGRNLCAVHIESIYILRMLVQQLFLSLPRVDHSSTLHISFLTGARSTTGHSLAIGSALAFNLSVVLQIINVWIEVVASS